MKNFFFPLFRLAFIMMLSFIFFNCEKDEVIPLVPEAETIQTILDFEAKNVAGTTLFKENKELDRHISTSFLSNDVREDQLNSSLYNFSIDTDNVQVISGDTFDSYTFIVKREASTPNILENYILTIFNDGGYAQMLVTYPYVQENGEIEYIFSQATVQYIIDTNLLLGESSSPCPSTSEEIIAWEDGGCIPVNCGDVGNHSPGQACDNGEYVAHWQCSGAWAVTGCVYTSGGFNTGATDPSNATTNGGSSTGTNPNPNPTPNYPLNIPIIPKTETLLNIDGITLEMNNWLNNNIDTKEELLNFLNENNWSSEAQEEVKLTIQAESIQPSQWDYSRTGIKHGKQSLTYIAAYDGFDQANGGGSYTMYLLESGHILCESTTRRIINSQDANTIASQDYAAVNYYYVQINEIEGVVDDEDQGLKRWYTYRMPPNSNNADCISCGIDYLFQLAIANSLIITGRYIIPVEDAFIVITGEDFEGVESSRAVAGTFLALEIIGAGQVIKLLRSVKHVDEVFDAVEAVYRYMDEVYEAQKKKIKDVLKGDIPLETGNNIRKGNFGEMVTDTDLTSLGYEPLHDRITDIDLHSGNGIDGVFKNPNTGEYLIVESKYNTSTLSSTLDGKQMSDSWIHGTQTGVSRLVEEVGEDLADEIVAHGYKRIVSKIAPDGSNFYQLLDSNANIIEIWFP